MEEVRAFSAAGCREAAVDSRPQNVQLKEGETEAKQKDVSEWSAVFLRDGGLQHVYNVLMGVNLDQVGGAAHLVSVWTSDHCARRCSARVCRRSALRS